MFQAMISGIANCNKSLEAITQWAQSGQTRVTIAIGVNQLSVLPDCSLQTPPGVLCSRPNKNKRLSVSAIGVGIGSTVALVLLIVVAIVIIILSVIVYCKRKRKSEDVSDNAEIISPELITTTTENAVNTVM